MTQGSRERERPEEEKRLPSLYVTSCRTGIARSDYRLEECPREQRGRFGIFEIGMRKRSNLLSLLVFCLCDNRIHCWERSE